MSNNNQPKPQPQNTPKPTQTPQITNAPTRPRPDGSVGYAKKDDGRIDKK